MDEIHNTASAREQTLLPTPPVSQKIDEAAGAGTEITATSTIEERFANWGSD